MKKRNVKRLLKFLRFLGLGFVAAAITFTFMLAYFGHIRSGLNEAFLAGYATCVKQASEQDTTEETRY